MNDKSFFGLTQLMPRRIPDYPDGYAGWNSIISLGTILTFISIIMFLFIVSHLFNNKKLITNWNAI